MAAASEIPVCKAGDELMAEAKKKTESMMGWFSDAPTEEAAEMFAQAASKYKNAKSFAAAGEAFIQSAKCYEKLKSAGERSAQYVQAGQCFKKIPDVGQTEACYEEAINFHADNNQFSQAAKLYQELAELFVAEHQEERASDFYFKASDCFNNANSATSGYQCLIKAADLLVSQKQYRRAIELYEKVASKSYNDLAKWSVKEYFFKSLLAYLAMDQTDFVSNVEAAKTAMGKYVDEFPAFKDTREQQFVQKLIEARDEDDEEKFSDAVFEFDRISRLNQWYTSVLTEVKKQFGKADDVNVL